MKKAARSVTPYSLVGETGANVPALKHFFPMTEQSGSVITDTKGGCVWDVSSGGSLVFNQATRTVSTTLAESANPIPLTNGEFHTFTANKPFIALCVGRPNGAAYGDDEIYTTATRFALGDGNDILGIYTMPSGLGMSNNQKHHAACGNALPSGTNFAFRVETTAVVALQNYPADYDGVGTLAVTFTAGYYSQRDVMFKILYQPNGTQTFVQSTVDDAVAQIEAPTTNYDRLSATSEQWSPNPCMRFANIGCYGYAIFEFDTLPADHEIACIWMAQEWKRGNRVIWPGWIGKT